MRVGLVSDTHGLVDPSLAKLLAGAEVVLHAGDVCGQHVLDALGELGPVRAIHGNCDVPPLSRAVPGWRVEELEGWRILILHDLGKPEKPTPAAAALLRREAPRIVLSGHSHQGLARVVDGVLYVNPGSAGRKRFKLARSCGILELGRRRVEARVLSLEAPLGKVLHAASLQG